jgi:hypothetical protein
MNRSDFAFLGFGAGLRRPHYARVLEQHPRDEGPIHEGAGVDWFEVISENFMVEGGRPLEVLEAVRAQYPVVMHGVSLSIGSSDPLNRAYLAALRALARRFEAAWVSDHLCWTGVEGFNSHDLLPLPYTEEALELVCANVMHAQDVLERPLLLENPSSYLTFADDEMSEWAFIADICRRTGCFLLLDVNNIYVSGTNHGFDPLDYIAGIPADRVRQIHLAGHSAGRELLIDTHDQPVPDPVWALYEVASARVGAVAAMVERDDNIPPLDDLLAELEIARTRAAGALRGAA